MFQGRTIGFMENWGFRSCKSHSSADAGFQDFGQQGMPAFMMPSFIMPGFMMNAMAQGLPLPNQRLVTMGEPPMAGDGLLAQMLSARGFHAH